MSEVETALRDLESRRGASNDNAMRVAAEMIAGVRAHGDAFVREQIERFDRLTLDEILVTPRETSIASIRKSTGITAHMATKARPREE